MKKVEIYTDGACSGNPGVGGWGCILIYKSVKKEFSGGEKMTTNNRMEMFAVIYALEQLKEKCEVNVYSDSAYVVNAINNGWLNKWKKFGFKKTLNSDTELKNIDLWKRLDLLLSYHIVNFIKVKGHSDNALNNRCDELARNAILKIKNTI